MDFPEDQRKGQAIFNFLEWLRLRGNGRPSDQAFRMADPFHIEDERFNELWEEYLNSL